MRTLTNMAVNDEAHELIALHLIPKNEKYVKKFTEEVPEEAKKRPCGFTQSATGYH
jgi:hypothetical protein